MNYVKIFSKQFFEPEDNLSRTYVYSQCLIKEF